MPSANVNGKSFTISRDEIEITTFGNTTPQYVFGTKHWWVDGVEVTEQEFNNQWLLETDSRYRMTNIGISQVKALEIQILQSVAQKYGSELPVRITFGTSPVMLDWCTITISIPGQSRVVAVTREQLKTYGHSDLGVISGIIDEVLFAIFLLLDEDEDG